MWVIKSRVIQVGNIMYGGNKYAYRISVGKKVLGIKR
jgi:hypothetical protein